MRVIFASAITVVLAIVSLLVIRNSRLAGGYDRAARQQWLSPYVHVIHLERISVVNDPVLGARRKVGKFTVYDSDLGPTENPRAQVETRADLTLGTEFWAGWSTLFPSDWPKMLPCGVGGWLTFESVYGPPYEDSSPVHLGMRGCSGNIVLQRNVTYGWDVPWEMPIPRGSWIDFVIHEKLSTDPAVGFVELYVNSGTGWRQQELGGKLRLYMRTLDGSNDAGPNSMRLELYRLRNMFPTLTLYHADHKIGASFAAVAPRSYGS
jgi:hypothetical protein